MTSSPETLLIFDERILMAQILDNEAIFIEIIKTFLAELPVFLIDIRQGIDNGDVSQAFRAAHTLSGASANIGASLLQQTARELELALANHGISDETAYLLQAVETAQENLCQFLATRGTSNGTANHI